MFGLYGRITASAGVARTCPGRGDGTLVLLWFASQVALSALRGPLWSLWVERLSRCSQRYGAGQAGTFDQIMR